MRLIVFFFSFYGSKILEDKKWKQFLGDTQRWLRRFKRQLDLHTKHTRNTHKRDESQEQRSKAQRKSNLLFVVYLINPSSALHQHTIMHTVWVRLNAVVFFGLTVLLGLSCMAALSKMTHVYHYKPSAYSFLLLQIVYVFIFSNMISYAVGHSPPQSLKRSSSTNCGPWNRMEASTGRCSVLIWKWI